MFKRILSCLFGGRQKVQVTKFAFKDFIFVVSSAANSVGTTLEFAAVPTLNIAQLVPSVHNHGFCGGPNAFSQEKRQRVDVEKHIAGA